MQPKQPAGGKNTLTLDQLLSRMAEQDMDLLERHAMGGHAQSEDHLVAPAKDRLIGMYNFYTNKDNCPASILRKDLIRGIATHMAYDAQDTAESTALTQSYQAKRMYWMLGGVGAGLLLTPFAGFGWGMGAALGCLLVSSYYGAKGVVAEQRTMQQMMFEGPERWHDALDRFTDRHYDAALEKLREEYQPLIAHFLSADGPLAR